MSGTHELEHSRRDTAALPRPPPVAAPCTHQLTAFYRRAWGPTTMLNHKTCAALLADTVTTAVLPFEQRLTIQWSAKEPTTCSKPSTQVLLAVQQHSRSRRGESDACT